MKQIDLFDPGQPDPNAKARTRLAAPPPVLDEPTEVSVEQLSKGTKVTVRRRDQKLTGTVIHTEPQLEVNFGSLVGYRSFSRRTLYGTGRMREWRIVRIA